MTRDRTYHRRKMQREKKLTSISKVPRVPGEKTKFTAAAGAEQLVPEVVYARANAAQPRKSVDLQDIVTMLWAR